MARAVSSNPWLVEGKRLARPCLWLRARRTSARQPLAGIWGGPGIVAPPRGDWEHHWVSVSCSWLHRHTFDLKGCISVYCDEDMDEFVAVNDPRARLPRRATEGLALYGQPGRSFPPDRGVEAYGSPAFRRWRAEVGKQENLEAWGEYEKLFRQYCPLYQQGAMKDVDVMLGGWHINWHGDRPLWKHTAGNETASYDCGKNRLVLRTFRNAEPWVEVWQDRSGKLHAWGLIT